MLPVIGHAIFSLFDLAKLYNQSDQLTVSNLLADSWPTDSFRFCWKEIAPYKVIQDSIRFWIPDSRCWILDSTCADSGFQNTKDSRFYFLVCSNNFCILSCKNDFKGGFCYWRTCCVNACLYSHFSITTFGNYKKYFTANQGINFSSKNTYRDCPFLKSNVHSFYIFLATLKRHTYHISFIQVPPGSSSDLVVSK